MLTSTQTVKRKIIGCGVDERKLGRWAWTRYQGKHELTVRVISAYRPGIQAGAHTVCSQQRSYFDNLDDSRQPRDIMLTELCEAIQKWQDEGDSIILLMDANEDVSNEDITAKFQILGMKEAILDRHKARQGLQPTYNRGRVPIDGIFVSDNIEVEAAGYLPFGESPSDHRGLWVQIKEESIFGYSMEKVVPVSARRLTLDNPKVVRRWIELYRDFLTRNALPQRLYHLQTQVSQGQWNAQLQAEYENIRIIRRQGIELADAMCRKL